CRFTGLARLARSREKNANAACSATRQRRAAETALEPTYYSFSLDLIRLCGTFQTTACREVVARRSLRGRDPIGCRPIDRNNTTESSLTGIHGDRRGPRGGTHGKRAAEPSGHTPRFRRRLPASGRAAPEVGSGTPENPQSSLPQFGRPPGRNQT